MERIRWTEEMIKDEALKHDSRTSFYRKGRGAYQAARRRGILCKVCSHMQKGQVGAKIKWTEENIRREAKKFNSRSEFEKEARGAYVASVRAGILDSICAHMECGYIRWTEDMIKKEALKYNTRHSFDKNSNKAYGAARRKGILDDVCSHMVDASHYARPEDSYLYIMQPKHGNPEIKIGLSKDPRARLIQIKREHHIKPRQDLQLIYVGPKGSGVLEKEIHDLISIYRREQSTGQEWFEGKALPLVLHFLSNVQIT